MPYPIVPYGGEMDACRRRLMESDKSFAISAFDNLGVRFGVGRLPAGAVWGLL